MNETIKNWIADQTKKGLEKFSNSSGKKIGYSMGLTKGIEIAEGFSEWTTNGGWDYNSDDNIWRRWAEDRTTSQLLEQYLKTLEP